MRHYKEEDWLDFARETAPPARRSAIEAHLATGCDSCGAEAAFWKKLRGVAGRDLYPEPAVATLRLARAGWQAHRPEPRPQLGLIFDSYSQPLVAIATRASGPAWRHPRQMLFASDDLQVDLRLEPIAANGHGARVALVGQVQRRSAPNALAPSVPVRLFSGHRLIAETSSTPLGEFQLQFAGACGLKLVIGAHQVFEVLLPD